MLRPVKIPAPAWKVSSASMICAILCVAGIGVVSAESPLVGEALVQAIENGEQATAWKAIPHSGPFPESKQSDLSETYTTPKGMVSKCSEFARAAHAPEKSVIDFLAEMPEQDRLNAHIDFEVGSNATVDQSKALQHAANTWNSGLHNEALAALGSIGVSSEPSVAVGVAWKVPRPTSSVKMNSTQVGTASSNLDFVLESHWATGNVFVVAHDIEDGGNHYRVYLSTNNGETWTETYLWSNGFALTDFDAVSAGDYLYVSYIYEGAPTDVRLRRYFAATGIWDTGFGIETVFSDARVATEVELASSQDTVDTQIYLLGLLPDGVIRYFYANSNADSWNEVVTGVINADYGMDAQFNPNSADNHFLFVSYVGTDGNVWVYRRGGPTSNAWFDTGIAYFDYGVPLATYADTILIPYITSGTTRLGVRYKISYNAGDTWLSGTLESDSTPGDNCYSPAATGRGGSGFVVAYQMDETFDDHLHAKFRAYSGGGWSNRIQMTEDDLSWGFSSQVERLPAAGYGTIAATGGSSHNMTFDQSPLIFFDGMDLGNNDAWSQVWP